MNGWLDEVPGAVGGAGIVALGRVGEPADIADAVAFFASPDSRWVTGQVLEVNGGLCLGPMAAVHHWPAGPRASPGPTPATGVGPGPRLTGRRGGPPPAPVRHPWQAPAHP
jgi:hypothetical protein